MKKIKLNEEMSKWAEDAGNRRELQYSINKVKTNLYNKYLNREMYLVRMWGDNRIKAIQDFVTDIGYKQSPHHFYTLTLKEAIEWVEAIFKALNYRKIFKKNRITIKNICYKNDKFNIVTHKQKSVTINGIECYSIKRILEEMLKNKLIGTGFKINRGNKKVEVKSGKIVIKTQISKEEFAFDKKINFDDINEYSIEYLAWAVEYIAAELHNSNVNQIECGVTRLEF